MCISGDVVTRMMDVLLDCLSDENVEVREMASQMLSGVVRCSQRQSIIPLRVRRHARTLTGMLTLHTGSIHQTCTETWRS